MYTEEHGIITSALTQSNLGFQIGTRTTHNEQLDRKCLNILGNYEQIVPTQQEETGQASSLAKWAIIFPPTLDN